MSKNIVLFDFSQPDDINRWTATDDRVMGGVSSSEVVVASARTAAFQGTVSLENNGGFASVHAAVPIGILVSCVRLCLRCRGDGHTYSLRLREQNNHRDISWRSDFTGASDWCDIDLPLAGFTPVFRGRELTVAHLLDPARVLQVGILIAGQQAGDFRLELATIEGMKP